MLVNKITYGFISQQFDTETGKCITQSFTAADGAEFEDVNGNPTEEESFTLEYTPFELLQPGYTTAPTKELTGFDYCRINAVIAVTTSAYRGEYFILIREDYSDKNRLEALKREIQDARPKGKEVCRFTPAEVKHFLEND